MKSNYKKLLQVKSWSCRYFFKEMGFNFDKNSHENIWKKRTPCIQSLVLQPKTNNLVLFLLVWSMINFFNLGFVTFPMTFETRLAVSTVCSTFRYCRLACRRRRWVISCRLRLGPLPPVCEEEDSSFLMSIPTSPPTPMSSSVLLSSVPPPKSRTTKPPGWRGRAMVEQIYYSFIDKKLIVTSLK